MAGKNNTVSGYQEATNQLLAIKAQRKENIAKAKMEELITESQNNTLAQAAGFVSSQPTTMNADLNPATKNILGQYGLGQPKIQRSNSSSREVNKQNIVINNKNTTITNNNIQVAGGGPVQGRPVQMQDQGQIKFKTWLTNSFAQQNEISAKRKRDYDKRDAALERSSNKLMKKLDDLGTKVSANFNPKYIASSIGKQLKTILLLFGFGYLAKNWDKLINKVDEIGNFFMTGKGFVKMLGGKDNETVFEAFKNLFIAKDGILHFVGTWLKSKFEERKEAVGTVAKPDVSWSLGAGLGENITRILGNVAGYLGDILKAILDPTTAATSAVTSTAVKSEKEYQEKNHDILRDSNRVIVQDTNKKGEEVGKTVSASEGDRAIVEGKYQSIKAGSVDKNGNLVNTPIASISQGNELVSAIQQAEKGNIQTATVATGLSRLYKASKESEHGVILSEDFLNKYLENEDLKELGITNVAKHYVYVVRPKTEEEKALDRSDISDDTPILDTAAKSLGIGGLLFAEPTTLLTGLTSKVGGDLYKGIETLNNPNNIIELRDAKLGINKEAGERLLKGEDGYPKNLYEVPPAAIQKIVDKLTGKENVKIDLENEEFVKAIEEGLSKKVSQDVKPKNIKKDIDVDNTYRANKTIADNNAILEKEWEANRLNKAIDNTKEMVRDINPFKGGSSSNNGNNNSNGNVSSNSSANNNSDWSNIRINKKDNKTAHPGTGAIGKQNINRDYLTNLLIREISGEFGRKEGNPNGCYMNPQDGGAQAGHGNYGYGNTYIALKDWYKGPVNFKLADGSIKSFKDLKSADDWFVKYCKDNNTLGWKPADKKVVLTDETAAAINKLSISKFIDTAVKMDPEIMGAMDEQTLGGLLHIAYGGTGRYKKLINFYNTHKDAALLDLQANNGIHSEDFINRVMMNTPEGFAAMQTDNSNGIHYDRRGYLTGYHAFNVYKADEWDKHVNQSYASNNTGSVKFSASSGSASNTIQPTITASSNISSQYPSIFSSSSGNSSSFSSVDNIKTVDYSGNLREVNANLVTIQQILKVDSELSGHAVDATNNLTNTVSKIVRYPTSPLPSTSYTYEHSKNTSKIG